MACKLNAVTLHNTLLNTITNEKQGCLLSVLWVLDNLTQLVEITVAQVGPPHLSYCPRHGLRH